MTLKDAIRHAHHAATATRQEQAVFKDPRGEFGFVEANRALVDEPTLSAADLLAFVGPSGDLLLLVEVKEMNKFWGVEG